MAQDSKGNFHRAGFQARKADRMGAMPDEREEDGEHPEPGDSDGDHMHEAAEHLHKAEPGSKHMIISHDGYSYKSHGIHEDGTHDPEQGSHDAENIAELKPRLDKFFDEEAQEGKNDDGEEPEENQSLY